MALGTCQPKAAMWSRLVTQLVGVRGGGRTTRDWEQQGPQGGRPPRDTQNPGERHPEHGAHTLRGGHTTQRANRRQGRTQTGADPGEQGLRGQWGPAGWRRLHAPRSAPGWPGGAPSPALQVHSLASEPSGKPPLPKNVCWACKDHRTQRGI